jgi:FYVE zinc finger
MYHMYHVVNHLGVLMKQKYNLQEAYELLNQAYTGFTNVQGPTSRGQSEVCYNLAVVHIQMGDRKNALKYFSEAHTSLSTLLGPNHQHTLDALHWQLKCANQLRSENDDSTNQSSWKPNTHCEVCHSSFGLRQREHHCRICSRSVCSACSPYRSMVFEFDKKSPVRICSVCEQQGF